MGKIFSITAALCISTILAAQSGKVFDNLSMKSEILSMERKYAVYLPPDYETSQMSYPVLYLLHGGANNQITWVQLGEVMSITDKAIRDGIATPMVIVMPDASGKNRGYANDPSGKWQYEDFFFKEFMPYIEKTYRLRPGKNYRAISGLSMGGNGTFIYALHHPELFAAACPLSAGVSILSLEDIKKWINSNNMKASDERVEKWYASNNILDLLSKMPEEKKSSVRWYIDCGDDDPLDQVWEGNLQVHIVMRKNGIPHEFRIRDGAHNWLYWRSALPEVLAFVTNSFHN